MTVGVRVLVTNDDGIDAPGLRVLVGALVDNGYEPFVVAPDRNYSGAGGSILSLDAADGEHDQLRYEKRVLPEAPHAEAFALSGPPALCALMAVRSGFGPVPELAVSGINDGLNTGPAILHSGTVNAAITAARNGVPSLAVSASFPPDNPEGVRFDTAAEVAMGVLRELAGTDHRCVSLNVPAMDVDELMGLRSAPPASRFAWRSYVESMEDGVITRSFRKDDSVVHEPNSDSDLLAQGWATMTSLVGVGTVDCTDLVGAVRAVRSPGVVGRSGASAAGG